MSSTGPESRLRRCTMEKCEALSTKPEECRYSFFQHTACEFFPCHETAHPEDFNCLFCYCPLYALGDRCGGNFRYIGDGIKDCSGCLLPHGRKSYGYVTGKFGEIAELAKRTAIRRNNKYRLYFLQENYRRYFLIAPGWSRRSLWQTAGRPGGPHPASSRRPLPPPAGCPGRQTGYSGSSAG